jgi:hypothetical protein
VGADTDAPPEVFDRVVDALLAGVADALHGVAAESAHAGSLIALAHVDGVGRVSKVEAAGEVALLERSDLVAGGSRKTES